MDKSVRIQRVHLHKRDSVDLGADNATQEKRLKYWIWFHRITEWWRLSMKQKQEVCLDRIWPINQSLPIYRPRRTGRSFQNEKSMLFKRKFVGNLSREKFNESKLFVVGMSCAGRKGGTAAVRDGRGICWKQS
jgi:hypothetical protein